MPDLRIPESIWRWAQEQTGRDKPGSFLRDVLMNAVLEHERKASGEPTPEPRKEEIPVDHTPRWRALGAGDLIGHEARVWYIAQHDGDENAALQTLEGKERHGLNDPRGWLLFEWRNRSDATAS